MIFGGNGECESNQTPDPESQAETAGRFLQTRSPLHTQKRPYARSHAKFRFYDVVFSCSEVLTTVDDISPALP